MMHDGAKARNRQPITAEIVSGFALVLIRCGEDHVFYSK